MKAYVKKGIERGGHGSWALYNADMERIQGQFITVKPYDRAPYHWVGGLPGCDSFGWLDEWLLFDIRKEVRQARVQLLRAFGDVSSPTEVSLAIYRELRHGVGKDQRVGFSIDRDGSVAYSADMENLYSVTKRKKTSLQRYVRRQLGFNVSDIKDHELDLVCRQVVKVCHDGMFKVIRGDDVQKAYEGAVGCSSCMTYSSSRYTSMYKLNPDKVGMVVYESPRVTARALLWTCDDGVTVMDRIYPNDGGHVEIMHGWADSLGYVYRIGNSLPCGGYVKLSDGKDHVVTLKYKAYIPYMDTFRYGKRRAGKIWLSNVRGRVGMVAYDAKITGFVCQICKEEFVGTSNRRSGLYGHVCTDCWGTRAYCRRCERWFAKGSEDEVKAVDRGRYMWCRECREDKGVSECEKCGGLTRGTYVVGGKRYCSGCVSYCLRCDKLTLREEINKYEGLCEKCAGKEDKAVQEEHGEGHRVYADVETGVVLSSENTSAV